MPRPVGPLAQDRGCERPSASRDVSGFPPPPHSPTERIEHEAKPEVDVVPVARQQIGEGEVEVERSGGGDRRSDHCAHCRADSGADGNAVKLRI